MDDKNLFPDYEPKTTPDTIEDYLGKPNRVYEILGEIGEPHISKLNNILKLFDKYKKKAKKKVGKYEKGNVAIGADPDQYYPSEEELLVSELGKMIVQLIESYTKQQLKTLKLRYNIRSQQVNFFEISFRHVDVMGSGRFFYAEKATKETIINL
ncbi:MAG: hypothetical protein EAX91_09360 [Candidatus Lokiarchaeota archaeon]|nr:hypothetical protein [Candidatus Lokiarchaeota archaeon]